jgi:hypothetical protein
MTKIERSRRKAFYEGRVPSDACIECWSTGEATYFADGTISPGYSSSSIPCKREGCEHGKRVAAEWDKKYGKVKIRK